jgi:hypothetical protein
MLTVRAGITGSSILRMLNGRFAVIRARLSSVAGELDATVRKESTTDAINRFPGV